MNSPLRTLLSKRELWRGFTFLISIGAFYIFFYICLQPLIYYIESISTVLTSFFLSVLGVEHSLGFAAEPVIRVGSVDAVIGRLCAGDIEIAMVLAVIFATFDRKLGDRIKAALVALPFILIANAIRISTVLWVGSSMGWASADFVHDVLFRITLLVVVLLYYAFWYLGYMGRCAAKILNKINTLAKR